MTNCSIEGCENNLHAGGMCCAHYNRWYKYGDPKAGSTGKGVINNWIVNVALPYEGDECLKWPFAKTGGGYTCLYHKGKRIVATRYVCELVNGPPPTPAHQAAHSCGKGHEACIAPKHLRWATSSENQLERAIHGTDSRGERQVTAKLTEKDVLYIRSLRGKVQNKTLAEKYAVSGSHISAIQHGNAWAWLKAGGEQ